MERFEEVLRFWFGDVASEELDAVGRSTMWFKGSSELDREIRTRFLDDLERARRGALDAWAESPRGRLALIIVLDQFSRNIYRGTPAAFAADERCRKLVREGLERGVDRELGPVERFFFYLPLEHSEDLGDQEHAVRLVEQLLGEAHRTQPEFLDYVMREALAHRDVIRRFGRFPHRNPILKRESTAAEEEFVRSGPNWGQTAAPVAGGPREDAS